MLALASVCISADTVAFGPQTFSGTGRPVVSRPTFNVALGGNGYTLRVTNRGVLAVFIVLNGRVVIRPSDLRNPPDDSSRTGDSWQSEWDRIQRDWRQTSNDGTVPLVEKPVTLRTGTNEILVAFISRVGTSFTVEIVKPTTDTTPPVIAATVAPKPNANGWNNTDVTVTFACSDLESGIATCPAPKTVTTEGANQLVSGIAVDKAGNSATANVALKIDKTSPVVSATQSPNPNSKGMSQ